MKDIALAIALIVFVGLLFWTCTAPCEQLGWMPASDIPGRCLQVQVKP